MRASDSRPRTMGAGPTQALGAAPSQAGTPRHASCWGPVTPRGGFGSGTLGGLADLPVDAATQPFLRISLASALEHLTYGLPHGPLSSPFWLMHKPVVGPDTQDSDSPLGRWGPALWLSLQPPKTRLATLLVAAHSAHFTDEAGEEQRAVPGQMHS